VGGIQPQARRLRGEGRGGTTRLSAGRRKKRKEELFLENKRGKKKDKLFPFTVSGYRGGHFNHFQSHSERRGRKRPLFFLRVGNHAKRESKGALGGSADPVCYRLGKKGRQKRIPDAGLREKKEKGPYVSLGQKGGGEKGLIAWVERWGEYLGEGEKGRVH